MLTKRQGFPHVFLGIGILFLIVRGSLPGQQLTRRAWTILAAGAHDTSAAKRSQAVSTLRLIARNPKATEMPSTLSTIPTPISVGREIEPAMYSDNSLISYTAAAAVAH